MTTVSGASGTVTGTCVAGKVACTSNCVAAQGTITVIGTTVLGTGFVPSRNVYCTLTDSAGSIGFVANVLPPQPTAKVTVVSATQLKVEATFPAQDTSIAGFVRYMDVQAKCTSAATQQTKTVTLSVTSGDTSALIDVPELTAGTQYSCVAALRNAEYKFADSEAISATTLDDTGAPVTTSVRIVSASADPRLPTTTIKIDISYSGIGAGGQCIAICGTKSSVSTIAGATGAATPATVTVPNMAPTTQYTCRVYVTDLAGNTAFSSDVSGVTTHPLLPTIASKTAATPETFTLKITYPINSGDSGAGTPNALTINEVAYDSLAFVHNPVAAMKITCSATGVSQPPVVEAAVAEGSSEMTAVVEGLVASTDYSCTANQRNVAGKESPASKAFTAATSAAAAPNKPAATVAAIDSSSIQVTLSWSKADQNGSPVTRAIVSCAPEAGGPSAGGASVAVATDIFAAGGVETWDQKIKVSGLAAETVYSCYGNITNSAGISPNSEPASTQTSKAPPPAPAPTEAPAATPVVAPTALPVTTPAPVETTPAPVETTPAPVVTTPAPAPVETTPAPAPATPAPVVTTPAPVETTPAPVVTTPAPAVTTPAPAPVETTPAPAVTTPAPAVTTPAPAPVETTPAPAVTTPAPAVTTPAPAASTPAPAASTPAPAAPAPAAEAPKATPLPGFDEFGCRLQPQWVTATLVNVTTVRIQWGPSQAGSTQPVAGRRTLLAKADAGTDDDDLADGLGYSRKYKGCRDWAVGLYEHGKSYAINSARWASEALSKYEDASLLVSVGDSYKMNRAVFAGTFYDVRLVLVRTGQARQLGAATSVVEFPAGITSSVTAQTAASITVSFTRWAFSAAAFPGTVPGAMFGLNAAPTTTTVASATPLAGGAAVKVTVADGATTATISGLAADSGYFIDVVQAFSGLTGSPLAASRAFVKTSPAAGKAASTAATDIPVAALFTDADLADYVDDASIPTSAAVPRTATLSSVGTLTVSLQNVPCSALTSDLAKAILNDLKNVLNVPAATVKLATIRCVPTATSTSTSTGGSSGGNSKKPARRLRAAASDDALELTANVRAPAGMEESVGLALDHFQASANAQGLALNSASSMLGTSITVDRISSSKAQPQTIAGLPVGVAAGVAGIVGGVVVIAVVVGIFVVRRQRAVARVRASAAAAVKARALGKAPSTTPAGEQDEEADAVVTQMASVLTRQPSLRKRGESQWNPLRRLQATNNAVAPEEPEEQAEQPRASSPRSPVSLRSPSMEVRAAESTDAAGATGKSVVFVNPALGEVNAELKRSRDAKLGVPRSGSSRRARSQEPSTIAEEAAAEAQAEAPLSTATSSMPRRLPPIETSTSPQTRASLGEEEAAHDEGKLGAGAAARANRSPGHAVRGGYAAVEGGQVLDIAINRKGGKPLRK